MAPLKRKNKLPPLRYYAFLDRVAGPPFARPLDTPEESFDLAPPLAAVVGDGTS